MSFLPALAWKNLFRYRRRTIITAGVLAVGLAIYIFVDSMLLGAELESDRNLIWYETSSARIMSEEYWAERARLPLRHVIEEPEPMLDRLAAEGIPAAPRTVFAAELVVHYDPFPEDGSMMIRVFAIDPERDDDVFRLRPTVTEGRYLEPGEDGVMLGAWLAQDLGAEVGFPVTLVTRTRHGFFQTMDAEVVGILNCPNPYINRSGVFVPLDSADHYLQMEETVTEINLAFPPAAGPDERTAALRKTVLRPGDGLTAMSWRELASDYVALTQTKDAGTGIVLFLVFVIAAVGVSNTMLMTIFERVREIGMMRALGMPARRIRRLFLMEAAGIGIIGASVGVVVGILANIPLVSYGIDYSGLVRQTDIGYRTAGILYGAWNPGTIVTAFFLGIGLAALIALVPIRRALRMGIPDALHHQ